MCVRVGNRKGVVKLGGWRATRSTQHPGKGRLLAIVTDSNRDVMCRKARKDARGPARAKGVILFHCFITSRVCDSRVQSVHCKEVWADGICSEGGSPCAHAAGERPGLQHLPRLL